MDLTEKPDAYCGLYCGACPTYMRTKAAVADGNTDIASQQDYCLGCKSAVVSKWCSNCPLKNCAKDAGYQNCAECKDYPCEPMQGFIEAPQWKYHIEAPYYIAIIRKHNTQEWIRRMKQRWSCPSCGAAQNWFAKTCPSCGAAQRGYDSPEN